MFLSIHGLHAVAALTPRCLSFGFYTGVNLNGFLLFTLSSSLYSHEPDQIESMSGLIITFVAALLIHSFESCLF